MASEPSGVSGIILYLVCTYSAKTRKEFVAKIGSKRARMAKFGNLGNVTQNPHFLKKCKKGTKKNFSKIVQKVALT